MLIASHLSNSFRLVNFSEMDNNKSACHIELENIEKTKKLIYPLEGLKKFTNILQKKMDLVYN